MRPFKKCPGPVTPLPPLARLPLLTAGRGTCETPLASVVLLSLRSRCTDEATYGFDLDIQHLHRIGLEQSSLLARCATSLSTMATSIRLAWVIALVVGLCPQVMAQIGSFGRWQYLGCLYEERGTRILNETCESTSTLARAMS